MGTELNSLSEKLWCDWCPYETSNFGKRRLSQILPKDEQQYHVVRFRIGWVWSDLGFGLQASWAVHRLVHGSVHGDGDDGGGCFGKGRDWDVK